MRYQNSYSLFVYAVRSQVTKDYYLNDKSKKPIKIFFYWLSIYLHSDK